MLTYLMSLVLFLNSSSNFFFWILLEINMIIFICLNFYSLSNFPKMELFDFSLFYFFVQSIGSIFFLTFCALSTFFNLGGSIIFTIMSMSLKSGIFPFYFWVYSSIEVLGPLTVTLLLSFQKVPVYIYLFSLSSTFILFILVLSMLAGSLNLFGAKSWNSLMVSSSIYSVFWIFGLFFLGLSNFFYFFFFYFPFVLFFTKLNYTKFFHGTTDFVTCGLIFLFFLGLPPLSMFFFKLYFFNFLVDYSSFSLLVFIWILIFFSLFGYMKFIYSFFLNSNFLFNFKTNLKKMIIFLFSLGMFPLLLSFSSKLFKLLSSYLK